MLALTDIRDARGRIAPFITQTPLLDAGLATAEAKQVMFKLESLQRTGAFKIRGASNCLALLTDEERARGVIAASAGNHAQGVAAAATRLGISARIVMPAATPLVKVDRTRKYGAEVILSGADFDEARVRAEQVCAEDNLVFVHPFADERVIAGQGTIGLEILEQQPDVTSVVVPVGGGGLISGIACAINVQVFGVQTEMASAMQCSFEVGRAVSTEVQPTIADGIAVGQPCEITCALAQQYVDDIVIVREPEIATAMLRFLEDYKLVVEGAAAVPYAALDTLGDRLGQRPVLVISGGNADVTTLGAVIDRGLAQAGRSVRLLVDLPDVPGALAKLASLLSASRANIIEIYHNRTTGELEVGKAEVELVLSTRGHAHVQELLEMLQASNYNARAHGHG